MADAPKPDAKQAPYVPPKELEQKAAVQKFQGRPKRQPVEQAEYFYNVKGTHIAFFVASLGLLVSFLMMFHKDYARPWKPYQTGFAQMDFEKLWYDMKKLEGEVKDKQREINDLDSKINQFMSKFPDKEGTGTELDAKLFEPELLAPPGVDKPPFNGKIHLWVNKAKQKLSAVEQEQIRGELYAKNQAQNFAKDELGAVRFRYEDSKHHYEEALKSAPDRVEHFEREFEHEKKDWERVNKEVADSKAAYDECQKRSTFYEDFAAEAEKRAKVKGIWEGGKSFNALKEELAAKKKELSDKETRFSKEKPSFANTVRNAPGADFFAPTLKVRNHIVLNIKDQLNFAQVTKVDRCDTCHVGIDNPVYEVRFHPDAEKEEDRVVFKNEFLRAFVAHARGQVDPSKCVVCLGHKETDEIKQPMTPHGSWSGADAVKFTKVFMAHPRLDLFVKDSSHHPLDKFGCTICHEGDGRDTDFTRVVHTPNTAKQGEAWRARHGTPYGEEKYNWNYRELWDLPMFPTKYVQASCRRCHPDAVELDGAEKYVKGMKLVERIGCYGCHRIDSYQILPKDLTNPTIDDNRKNRRPGPPLLRIATKVTEDWAAKWVLAPREFRPTTRMPHFFGLSNTRHVVNGNEYQPEMKAGVLRSPIDDTIVNAIVKYVFSLSETQADPAPPGLKGDGIRGEILVKSLGCVGCHKLQETPLSAFQDHGEKRNPRSRFLEEFAPTLSAIGSKMNKTWLFHWVRNPRKHFGESLMPNLRLSEQDAADVVEYLMTLKKPDWEKIAPPESNDKIVDDLIRELLSKAMSTVDVEIAVAGKSPGKMYKELATKEGKVKWLGRKMVKNYGCYSCHQLKTDSDPDIGTMNWQAEEGIGVELSGSQPWGSKHADKLDFGFTEDDGVNHHGVHFKHGFTGEEISVHVDETRADWLEHKLANPRVFDGGKMASKPWDELLRMPLFALNEEEIEAIATFVQSFTDHNVTGLVEGAKKRPSPEEMAKYRGDRLVRNHNCRACHRLSLDRMTIEWKHKDENGKELTEWPEVEGRFGREEPADSAENSLRKWKNPTDKKPLLEAGEDLKKSGKKLFTFSWTSDHSTLAMSGVVNPDSKFVYFDGDDEWYLDVQGGQVKEMRPILRHHPMEGGEIIPELRKFKKDLSEATKPYDAKDYDKYTDFMDISNDGEFETRYAPMLRSQGVKTQTDWLFRFLKAPYPIRPTLQPIYPGAKTLPDINLRMPTFDFSDEEANSLTRWFAVRDHQQGKDFYPNTEFPEREERFIEARKAALDKVGAVIRNSENGCASCHYMAGGAPPGVPLKHAPDLARVEERLRPRWLYEWVDVPANIYPGTTMTSYDFKPIFGGNQRDGVHAAVEYMLNFGKFSTKSSAAK